ncbi:MAG: urea transporter [Alphaproteobacteria bacterium]|nr:urea transporter [Alphaproteobacteria bacterium]
MAFHFRWWPNVALTGVGQVAFSDSVVAGVLVTIAIGAISPLGAASALLAALFGTAVAYTIHSWNGDEKRAGLPGVNLAILMLFWTGAFEVGQAGVALLVMSVITCMAFEQALKRILAGTGIPPLSVPALASAYLVASAYGLFGDPFWYGWRDIEAGPTTALFALAAVAVALALKSAAAALQTAVLVGASVVISVWVLGRGPIDTIGLWGFTVAPIAFGLHAVFFAGAAIGAWWSLVGVALGAAIWALWIVSPLAQLAPPLLTPFVIAVWATLAIARAVHGRWLLDAGLWDLARAARTARSNGQTVAVLTGAGISTGSDIPDYTSGAWLDASEPLASYSWNQFLASGHARRAYWEACFKFRETAERATPNAGHGALAALQAAGWIDIAVTQNVDRLHQRAGSDRTVELHGRIDQVRCLDCDRRSNWPGAPIWRQYDQRCTDCGGLLKPAVIAFGEEIPPKAWSAAEAAIEKCGVLVVIGTQIAVSSAAALVARARERDAKIAFINPDVMAFPSERGDIVIPAKSEDALPALACLLDCPVRTGGDMAAVVVNANPSIVSPSGIDTLSRWPERVRAASFGA